MQTIATHAHAAYRKLSAARHERTSRVSATYLCHPLFATEPNLCRRRKCSRDGVCSGEMRPSTHLAAQLRLLYQHGLSSNRSTVLPACLAAADDDLFADYEASKQALDEQPTPGPELFWPDFVWYFKDMRRQARRRGATAADPNTSSEGPV